MCQADVSMKASTAHMWDRSGRNAALTRAPSGTVHLRNCLYLVYAKVFTRTLIFQSSKNSANSRKSTLKNVEFTYIHLIESNDQRTA